MQEGKHPLESNQHIHQSKGNGSQGVGINMLGNSYIHCLQLGKAGGEVSNLVDDGKKARMKKPRAGVVEQNKLELWRRVAGKRES